MEKKNIKLKIAELASDIGMLLLAVVPLVVIVWLLHIRSQIIKPPIELGNALIVEPCLPNAIATQQ